MKGWGRPPGLPHATKVLKKEDKRRKKRREKRGERGREEERRRGEMREVGRGERRRDEKRDRTERVAMNEMWRVGCRVVCVGCVPRGHGLR